MEKILVLHSGVELYGSDRSLLQNLETIKKQSNAHVTVVLHKDGPLADYLYKVVDKVEFENFGVLSRDDVSKSPVKSFWQVLKGAYRLNRRVRGVDLVYINTLTVFSSYILFPFLFRKQKVVNIREIASGFQRIFFSILLRASRAKLIFNSCVTRDSYLFLPKARSEVLYNFIDVSVEKSVPVYQSSNGTLRNILILGRVYPLKGQELALKALEQLKGLGIEFELRIVGGPAPGREDYMTLIESYIKNHSLSHIVTVSGFQNDVSELYEWADIILVPSVYPESFGRTVIEGMALGKIVIASNHGGPSELIEHGGNGLLFEPGSISSLVECLRDIKGDTEKFLAISKNAEQHYRDFFTEDRFQSKLMNILGLDNGNRSDR